MFQTHCYDAWLGGEARNTGFLKASQLAGTIPAPIFLFLAGVSFALVADQLIRKNLSAATITRTMLRRGAEIFAFGLLFRLQEFLIAWGWAPWSDLLRVDVLNIIGLSMILMALVCGVILSVRDRKPLSNVVATASDQTTTSEVVHPDWSSRSMASEATSMHHTTIFSSFRFALVAIPVALAGVIALLTPLLYTTWRPTWLAWPLESYIDGCHNLGSPQPWLFPLFPWAAFAFAGLAAGFILFGDLGKDNGAKVPIIFGAMGAAAILGARQLDHSSFHLYSTYDYWHTSPNFLMMRIGMLLVIVFLSYAWCRWGWATLGFSPMIQLGQTSLLVYWVHIEFVYGRFSLMPKRAETIAGASRGLLEITLFMLLLSLIRTRIDWKKLDWSRTFISKKNSGGVQPA
jgi:uncharacterized membrane protein